jgi:hypothetical protein
MDTSPGFENSLRFRLKAEALLELLHIRPKPNHPLFMETVESKRAEVSRRLMRVACLSGNAGSISFFNIA